MPGGEAWAEGPPAWALPVTVAGDLVLVRGGGVLVSVGAICAYPVGFEFYLTIGFDRRQAAGRMTPGPRGRMLGFHVRTPEERQSATRVQVGLPGGMTADSVAYMSSGAVSPGEPVLRFSGGDSVIKPYLPVLRAEGRWRLASSCTARPSRTGPPAWMRPRSLRQRADRRYCGPPRKRSRCDGAG